MAKIKAANKVGRPQGPEKKPLNIYMEVARIGKLRVLAKEQRRNISTVVEDALHETFGI